MRKRPEKLDDHAIRILDIQGADTRDDEMRRRKNIFVIEWRGEIETFFADDSRSTMIAFAVSQLL